MLTSFDEPTPEALLQRYNLAQAQGVLYRASHVVITAHRNDPGEYKLLFRYLKLFGLMAYIEGDADHGFTLTIDGPASLFTPSTRYGLALAKLLPALLHVTRWSLTATLVPRQRSPSTTAGQPVSPWRRAVGWCRTIPRASRTTACWSRPLPSAGPRRRRPGGWSARWT